MSSPDEHIDRGIKYKQLILFWDYYSAVVLYMYDSNQLNLFPVQVLVILGVMVLQQGTQNCDLL